MFEHKRTFGQHHVLGFDKTRFKFLEYLQKVYNTNDLSNLHIGYEEFCNVNDIETPLHKKFYKAIKENDEFKNIYCDMIHEIYTQLFPNEPCLIYQSFPSIRFQFPGSMAVPKHCDSDSIGSHPVGERNFIIPLTVMTKTASVYVESEPGKGDFQSQDLEYGDLFYFNGNKCIHYNEPNQENYIRVSFDFRVVPPDDYYKYMMQNPVTYTQPRDENTERKPVAITAGGYYQIVFRDQPNWDWYHRKNTIVQSRPTFERDETQAVSEYIHSGDPFYTEFNETKKLEKYIQDYMNVKHCSMVTSGTAALICALHACNIGQGDEVIVPAYTMVATINAVKSTGATPIIIDVSRETCTVTPESVKTALTPKTKAVIHVSLNNRDAGLLEISRICKEHSVLLIEDAAQSVGCLRYGTVGDVACFSLSTPKIISTGQGGFTVTNNDTIAEKIRMVKNFGRSTGGVEKYDMFGLNFKYTDLQAVIGLAQFKKLPERIKRYKEIGALYHKYIPSIQFSSFPWFVDIIVDNRDELANFLKLHGIETRVCYPALADLPNANYISEHGLFLPTHMDLKDSEIKYICDIIKCFLSLKKST